MYMYVCTYACKSPLCFRYCVQANYLYSLVFSLGKCKLFPGGQIQRLSLDKAYAKQLLSSLCLYTKTDLHMIQHLKTQVDKIYTLTNVWGRFVGWDKFLTPSQSFILLTYN